MTQYRVPTLGARIRTVQEVGKRLARPGLSLFFVEILVVSLCGRKIIVTRPTAAGEELCRLLLAAGAQPILAPAISIEYEKDDASLKQVRDHLTTANFMLLTSQHGLMPLLVRGALELSKWPGVFVVGAQTANLARSVGLRVLEFEVKGGLTNLCQTLSHRSDLRQSTILWPHGDRSDLSSLDLLVTSGATILDYVVYRTVDVLAENPPATTDLLSADALVVASPSAIQSLIRALPPLLIDQLRRQLPILVIGSTTRDAVFAAGFQKVACAALPSNRALVQCAEQLFR